MTEPTAQPPAAPDVRRRELLTLRVSTDSGRTWGRLRLIRASACEPLLTSAWPPCECPRCR